jgi:D-alanine transaminase
MTYDFPGTCYLNGELVPLAAARISPLDRGFIFGDGVYEVVPVYARTLFRFEQHMARLERSLREVCIAPPLDRAGLRTMFEQLIATCDSANQYVYLQITRGVAKRDFFFPENATPTVFAMTSPLTRPTREQREVGLRAVTRPDERWLRCDIKSVSLLGAVLARQYATERGAQEVVQHRSGYLTEGSASNLWIVKNGTVAAPPRDHRILEGIRYGFLAELCAQLAIPFEERPVRIEEVAQADELMLTAATREVLPIVELDGRAIGTGRPGPVYAKLRAAYDAAIDAL